MSRRWAKDIRKHLDNVPASQDVYKVKWIVLLLGSYLVLQTCIHMQNQIAEFFIAAFWVTLEIS